MPILSIFLFFIIRYLKQNWALSRQRRAYKKDNIRLSFYLIQPIGVCVCMYLIRKRYRIKCNNTKWKCCNIQCTDTCLLLNKHCQTMWLYFHVIKKPTTHSAHLQDRILYHCVYKIERNSKKKNCRKQEKQNVNIHKHAEWETFVRAQKCQETAGSKHWDDYLIESNRQNMYHILLEHDCDWDLGFVQWVHFFKSLLWRNNMKWMRMYLVFVKCFNNAWWILNLP